ncbi:MAG: ABC transporter substrate-binding protein [Candidatus Methanomethylophilaceae archaeon]
MDSSAFKVYATVALLMVGGLSLFLVDTGQDVTRYQSEGVGIDFQEWNVTWTNMDFNDHPTSKSALEYACEFNGFDLQYDSEGNVVKIADSTADGNTAWNLFVIEPGSSEWKVLSAPYDQDLSKYTVAIWAYRGEGEVPTVALDATGSSIFGYPQKRRSITLSPSLTEMMSAVGGIKTLVGTDKYSDYPEEVLRMRAGGDIAVVGDYTTPNFESIMKADPDVVFCDGSQYNHIQMAERLKKVNVCAILMYEGTSIDTIMNNIYIMGRVMGYSLGTEITLGDLEYAMDAMTSALDSSSSAQRRDIMISLSGDMSPWVSGSYTFAGDIADRMYGDNVFSDLDGWVHINSEMVIKKNPSVIIILTTDYGATQSEYDILMSSLSKEWKGTDAYKNGEIYLITEGAGEMAQRAGPRYAQLAELVARILNPDVFDDIEMSKFIGDDYRNYLTYTKTLG